MVLNKKCEAKFCLRGLEFITIELACGPFMWKGWWSIVDSLRFNIDLISIAKAYKDSGPGKKIKNKKRQ